LLDQQQFKAKKAQEELATDIAAMKTNCNPSCDINLYIYLQ
jgi:hypothetical protein